MAQQAAEEQDRHRRPVGFLLAVVIVVLGAGAALGAVWGRDDDPETFRTTSTVASREELRAARDGVCAAAARARAGDANAARQIFFGPTHQRLHDLAAAAARTDRGAAARMLEAKYVVESTLEQRGSGLPEALVTLGELVGRALAAAGSSDPGPCPS